MDFCLQDSSDEEDHKPRPLGRLPLCSMRVLCRWYAETVGGATGDCGLGKESVKAERLWVREEPVTAWEVTS
jgi:hypothetical protein